MADTNDPPVGPQTVVVDVPWPTGIWLAGILFTCAGLLVRCFARSLARPAEARFSWEPANTEWAYREAVYIDLGLVALAFGLSLIWLALARDRSRK